MEDWQSVIEYMQKVRERINRRTHLRNCPFCGHDVSLLEYGDRVYVKCNGCRKEVYFIRETSGVDNMDAARRIVVDAWNKRAS